VFLKHKAVPAESRHTIGARMSQPGRNNRRMVESAPRLDRRLVAAVPALYDARRPIAETNRRMGALASELGLPRPSYSQVRRLAIAEQRRRAERRERLAQLDRTIEGILRHRHAYELFGR